MTFAVLERALGMLLLDAAFCERFFLDPSSAACGCRGPGVRSRTTMCRNQHAIVSTTHFRGL